MAIGGTSRSRTFGCAHRKASHERVVEWLPNWFAAGGKGPSRNAQFGLPIGEGCNLLPIRKFFQRLVH